MQELTGMTLLSVVSTILRKEELWSTVSAEGLIAGSVRSKLDLDQGGGQRKAEIRSGKIREGEQIFILRSILEQVNEWQATLYLLSL